MLAILFKPFGFIAPKTLNYLGFQSFDFERHLMMVIPETYLMKVILETYLMKVILETYLMKVILETYLMKVILETYLTKVILETRPCTLNLIYVFIISIWGQE
jgi:hypothetical protein